MKTDDLIAALAADPVPGPNPAARAGRALPGALVLAVILVGLVLGYRDDLVAALGDPLSTGRYLLALALALLAGRLAFAMSRPEAPRGGMWMLALVPLAASVLWIGTLAVTPAGAVGMAITGKTMVSCLISIPSLSILTTGALIWALRQGAPVRPGLAGLLAGLAGGGLAAAAYALHCTEDSPLFYVTWYSTGILIAGALGALAGRRFLRW
jgi:hypothetical protein